MAMRESTIEKYFVKRCKELGVFEAKTTSPSAGFPDRVIAYGGDIFFAEFKATGEKLRSSQTRMVNKMRNAGCRVLVVDSIERVDSILYELILNGYIADSGV